MKYIFTIFTLLAQLAYADIEFSFPPSAAPDPENPKVRFIAKPDTRNKIPKEYWFISKPSDFIALQEWMQKKEVKEDVAISVKKDAKQYSASDIALLQSVVAVINQKK